MRKRQNAPSRKKPICGNTIGFAGAALSVLFALSLGWAGQAKPLPHPGPWPIQQGHNLQPRADQLEAMRKKVPQSVGACYELVESRMLKGPWIMGKSYTIADPYLFTLAQWLEDDGVDPARIPRVMEHRSRMAERANVKRAIAEELAS